MGTVEASCEGLTVSEPIFKGVSFYITGKVPEKIEELLKQGGGERMNYFSDYVTHLVCGEDAEDADLCDANDIYEVPAVNTNWIVHSARLGHLLDTKPYRYVQNNLFSGMVFCLSGLSGDRNILAGIVTYFGGTFQLNLNGNCTHLIAVGTGNEKYSKSDGRIMVISPDWILECVRNKKLVDAEPFHPRLILWPKKGESTTAITGFEPEEAAGETAEQISDSTQALLEKLKQRMPWNVTQPATTGGGEIIPPNVVAPSYASTKLPQPQELNQSKMYASAQKYAQPAAVSFLPSSNQIPKSIVHHTPQGTTTTTVDQQSQRMRVLEHLQQSRGLQQRIQQQQGVSGQSQTFMASASGQQQAARAQIQQNQELLMRSSTALNQRIQMMSPETQQIVQNIQQSSVQQRQGVQLQLQQQKQLLQQRQQLLKNQMLAGQNSQQVNQQLLHNQQQMLKNQILHQTSQGQQTGTQQLQRNLQQLAQTAQLSQNQDVSGQNIDILQGRKQQIVQNVQQQLSQGIQMVQKQQQVVGAMTTQSQGLKPQNQEATQLSQRGGPILHSHDCQHVVKSQQQQQGVGSQEQVTQGFQPVAKGLGQELGPSLQQISQNLRQMNQAQSSNFHQMLKSQQEISGQDMGHGLQSSPNSQNLQQLSQGMQVRQSSPVQVTPSNQSTQSLHIGQNQVQAHAISQANHILSQSQGLQSQAISTNQLLQSSQNLLQSNQGMMQNNPNLLQNTQNVLPNAQNVLQNNQNVMQSNQNVMQSNQNVMQTNQNVMQSNQNVLQNQTVLQNQQLLQSQQQLLQSQQQLMQNQGIIQNQGNQHLIQNQNSQQNQSNLISQSQQQLLQSQGNLQNQQVQHLMQNQTQQSLQNQHGSQSQQNLMSINQGIVQSNQHVLQNSQVSQGNQQVLSTQTQQTLQSIQGQQMVDGNQQILINQRLSQNNQILQQSLPNSSQLLSSQMVQNSGQTGNQLVQNSQGLLQSQGGQQQQVLQGQIVQNGNQQLLQNQQIIVGNQQQGQMVQQSNLGQSQHQPNVASSQQSQSLIAPNQLIQNQTLDGLIPNQELLTQRHVMTQQQQGLRTNLNQQIIQNKLQMQGGQFQGQNQAFLQQNFQANQFQGNPPLVQQKLVQSPQQQHLISQQQQKLGQQQQQQQLLLGQSPQTRPPNQHNIWQSQMQRQASGVIQPQPGPPRVQWAPNQQPGVIPQRQYIQLDAQTHQRLQEMSPEERTVFVQKLHKQRILQRAGHIVIRGGVPAQQQMQWLQQQAKQQGVILQQQQQQQNQQPPSSVVAQQVGGQQAPGLSPLIQQQAGYDQTQQQQQQQQQQQHMLQRQQQLRLQQLQLQREQAQKGLQGQNLRPIGPPPAALDPSLVIDAGQQSPLVVNPKTKTALANMLNTRLQGGTAMPEAAIQEPSAAGTLRLMTAQHNATLNNSNNRPQDILAMQQRRIITRPGAAEMIRPPAPSQPTAVTPTVATETKLQYSPRSSVPLQHRPGPYYGHNPNLKLPPDQFLSGCVFVVVEVEKYLQEEVPNWQKRIEKYGGEIEKQYCSRVTHVICETQRHGVVMQALRDCKRCVTLYWLSDVLEKKQVLPPWIALHLPLMYWDSQPASKHLISICGFTGMERDRVKHMIKYIGANLTTYFSKHNTLLICTKAEGTKYLHAKKWGTPTVAINWLTEVLLGHLSALNQLEHAKFQNFSDPPNFSFDPMLVPNLMYGWKMPINISQESFEKIKRSAAAQPPNPPRPKRIKLEVVVDENENEQPANAASGHRVLFSRCPEPLETEMRRAVARLGGLVVRTPAEATHLVVHDLKRTHKLLCCVASGAFVLPTTWLRASQAANTFADERDFPLDPRAFDAEYGCDLARTLATGNRNRLLEGRTFYVTPSVLPSRREVVELIHLAGGSTERIRRSQAQIEATNLGAPYSYIILTQENDLHLVGDVLRNKKDKVRIVCSAELVLSAVLRQTFEVEPYTVKVLQ